MSEHEVCGREIWRLMRESREKDAEIERLQDAGIKLVAACCAEDAEIERLKEQLQQLREDYQAQANHYGAQAIHHYAEWVKQRKLITELALGIDAVQLDTCMQEDWDALNRCAAQARERPVEEDLDLSGDDAKKLLGSENFDLLQEWLRERNEASE